FFMLSDYVVAVTLSESDLAQSISDRWIESGADLHMSAGYSCYCWLLGNRKDAEFEKDKILKMLKRVASSIREAPANTQKAMSNFLYTVAISYVPLHEEALSIAEDIGKIEITGEKKKKVILDPYETIKKEIARGRVGFKRKYVRC
ncbi:MAG TPA: hypothetical protein VK861_11490, partial [Bacteroidales bacterium]|nr:hypothetical protein [Bacteroidales bacterium]